MKHLGVLVTVVTGVTIVTVTAMANATVINVPDDYAEIQAAIEAANEGDIVLVQPGTYVETLDFLGKGITVTGTAPEDSVVVRSTVVDANAQGSVVTFALGEDSTSVLAGVTLTGGNGSEIGCDGESCGGGITVVGSSPRIVRCRIAGNTAIDNGGGLYLTEDARPIIADVIVAANYGPWGGGGMTAVFGSAPKIVRCTFADNEARGWGGGVVCQSDVSPSFTATRFVRNTVLSYDGGAVHLQFNSSPSFTSCVFVGNSASSGGALSVLSDCAPSIDNCTLVDNSARGSGGAVYCRAATAAPTIINSVIWGNTPDQVSVDHGIATVSWSDVQGGFPGEGNIDADPMFTTYEGFDYALRKHSPCVDAGDPSMQDGLDWTDPFFPPFYHERNTPACDMGAYGGPEAWRWLPEDPPEVPSMILVPSGTFIMGDGVAHCGVDERQVTLTRDFWLGQYEVTNQEYLEAVQWAYDNGYVTADSSSVRDNLDGSTKELVDLDDEHCEIAFSGGVFSLRDAGHGINPDHAVKEVTWYGSVAYCDWLSLSEGLTRAYDHSDWSCGGGDPYSAEGYRLPTDAEWEFAAQWDDERIYPWGDESPQECVHANFDECVGWTSPVGSYPAGVQPNFSAPIYDLSGNVWEWANDWWQCDLGTSPEIDPPGPGSGSTRVKRGGSWGTYSASYLRASSRDYDAPAGSLNGVGFRLARSD